MPSVALHTPTSRSLTTANPSTPNPLPPLLHTPLGLAILEIQGSLNLPPHLSTTEKSLQIGSLSFPLLSSTEDAGVKEGPWMQKVWLFVGQNQRLTGELRKLSKPLGLVQRRLTEGGGEDDGGEEVTEELEIMEIVRWKMFFGGRPEFV